jgi:PST family polysaccharide transporter
MLKSLKNNSLILLITQFIIYFIQFLVIARLLFVLSLDVYGLIAFSQAFVAIAIMLLDFGFSISATNKLSKYRDNKKYVEKLILSILAIKFFLFFLLSILLIIFMAFNKSYSVYNNILLTSLPTILIISITPVWFFYGIERLFYYSLSVVIGKIFFACLIYFFIVSDEDYIYFPIFGFIGQFFALFYSYFVCYREKFITRVYLNYKFLFYTVNFTKGFIASRLALSFNTSSGILVLGIVGGPVIVGIYSLADQIYRVLQTCVGSLTVPLFAYTSKNNDEKLVIKIAFFLMIFISILCIILFFIKSPILIITQFTESILLDKLLNYFILVFWLNSFGTIIGYPLFAAIGRLHVVNSSLLISAFLYGIFLIYFYTNEVSDLIFYAGVLIFIEIYILIHRLVWYAKISYKL